MPCFASCRCQASRRTWIFWSNHASGDNRVYCLRPLRFGNLETESTFPPSLPGQNGCILLKDHLGQALTCIAWTQCAPIKSSRFWGDLVNSRPSLPEAHRQLQPRRRHAVRLRLHSLAAEAFMTVTIVKALSGEYSHLLWSGFLLTSLIN
jgi:hypothetical protein